MKYLRSPLIWYGGKGNLVHKLISFIPSHHHYVEVFGGAASLLFAKNPFVSKLETYNDINSDLVNFFRVLRDKEMFQEFYRKVCLTPYAREEWKFCKETYKIIDDPIEKAYRFFIAVRQSFSGEIFGGWSYSITASDRNMSSSVSRYLSAIELLPEFHKRMMFVQIENKDFREILKWYDTKDTFFYLDPPYLPETRKEKQSYEYEMSVKDHEELIDILLNVKGKVMLSGYPNELYKILEENRWTRVDFQTSCHAAGRTRLTGILGKGSATRLQPRTECIWINYAQFKKNQTPEQIFLFSKA